MHIEQVPGARFAGMQITADTRVLVLSERERSQLSAVAQLAERCRNIISGDDPDSLDGWAGEFAGLGMRAREAAEAGEFELERPERVRS